MFPFDELALDAVLIGPIILHLLAEVPTSSETVVTQVTISCIILFTSSILSGTNTVCAISVGGLEGTVADLPESSPTSRRILRRFTEVI
jgi:hypothetical protein